MAARQPMLASNGAFSLSVWFPVTGNVPSLERVVPGAVHRRNVPLNSLVRVARLLRERTGEWSPGGADRIDVRGDGRHHGDAAIADAVGLSDGRSHCGSCGSREDQVTGSGELRSWASQ